MAKAKVEATFSTEQSYKFFQKEFAKCVLHFRASAGKDSNLKNLTSGGTNKWKFDVETGVKCDGLLKPINIAIKKTFGEGKGLDAAEEDIADYEPTGDYVQDMLATIEATTSNFSTRLLACGL